MLALGMTIFLIALLAIGMPVGFSLAVAGTCGLYFLGGTDFILGFLETAPLAAVGSYELITIPMFLLMAEFVILSGIATELFACIATWVGRMPGGLAIATALTGAGFGAISGSSTAAAATLSATSIPAMLEHGYDSKLACGVVAISGTLAMLIPPSVALVLYGLVGDVAIGELLIAGIVPGALVALTIIATVLILIALDPQRAPDLRRSSLSEKLRSLRVAGPMALLFLMVTGVIYTGIATPTEAAGIGAFGAFMLALLYGRLTPRSLLTALTRATSTTCMVIMIIIGANIFGYFLTLTRATQDIITYVGDLPVEPWVILAAVLAVYLVLGCIMDQIAIILLTVPIVLPLMRSLGFDPVWFGVLVVLTAEVGMVTPPIGMNAFVVSRFTGRPLEEVFIGAAPHVVAHLLLIVLFVVFPQIILWLPSTMMTR
ncbi:TRAP transporter large permease [Afifella sp. IM 167]|uniref:TRAP transporter large permease n=1 Tax=Afifella sp. IM 167 TaxID=2033586 RepID=UPI001CD023FE|nr:TRAP transporter large permease subunit [Afifella sp. IM 167]MBZ8132372.1 C4-dicarboxylate ABC transporter permease [Afifella sp. IM 167]